MLLGPCVASQLGEQDELNVRSVVAARLIKRTADVSKDNEAGFAEVSWVHSFDSANVWASHFSLQFDRLLGSGILREAYASHFANWGIIDFGYLQKAVGQVQFFDEYNPWSRFYEHPLLWEQWGAGLRYDYISVVLPWALSTAAAVNGRESGFATMDVSFHPHWGSWTFSGGAVTYDPEENDHFWRIGTDGFANTGPVQWHTVASHTRYLGANSNTNLTMRPGREDIAMLELLWRHPLGEFKALGYTREYHKRFDHREAQISGEWLLLPNSHLGIGPRLDWMDSDGETSWFPRAVLEGRFLAEDKLGFRLEAGIRDYSESVVSRELMGSVWMRF